MSIGMRKQFTHAGGFFLAAGIIGGFVYGATIGDPLRWALIGTAAGAAIAVLLWLIDRSR